MKKFFLISMTVLFSLSIFSQPGSDDPLFNSIDYGVNNGEWADDNIRTFLLLNDGKILIGGSFTKFNGVGKFRLTRLNSDGSLDSTYVPSGNPNSTVSNIVEQNDGKIIITGAFSSYGGVTRNDIARIYPDGSLDLTFHPGSGFDGGYPNCFLFQDDGKIIIGGSFTKYSTIIKNCIVRTTPGGSVDPTFNSGSGANDQIWSMAYQSDGKIIIGGEFTSYDGHEANKIARLFPDGSLDTTFSADIGPDYRVFKLLIQSDGRILIGGDFHDIGGIERNNIARLNNDGSIDNSFNPGYGMNNFVYAIVQQDDGKLLVGGQFNTVNGVEFNRIARLNPDGSLDITFNPESGANDCIFNMCLQNDQNILIRGIFTEFNGMEKRYLTRLKPDGGIDSSFYKVTGSDNSVYATDILPDGKIMIAGDFKKFNNITRMRVARLNPDGTLDESFDPGLGADTIIYTLKVQNDGKIIIGGAFNNFNGVARDAIVRLNSDGSIDTSFYQGPGSPFLISTISLQNDGKIIFAGFVDYYNETTLNHICRLSPDGQIDTSFHYGTGIESCGSLSYDFILDVQSDGKILLGGRSFTYKGVVSKNLIRINTDGSVDTSFNIGTGFNDQVYAITIQDDGKILVGGDFTNFNGASVKRILRLNMDGSQDTSFNVGTGTNDIVRTVSVQSDGKIIIGGDFTSYNGTAFNRIARLNEDGSVDTEFEIGLGVNNTVFTSSIQNDDKIIIGGRFTHFNDRGRNRVARIRVCTDYFYDIESNEICVGDTFNWRGNDYSGEGVYYDSFVTESGCDSIYQMNLSINTIDANISLSGNTLSANPIGATYQWVDCENSFAPIPGATSNTFNPPGNGSYSVIITEEGCSDTSNCITTIGIIENSFSETISVFPNPTSGKLKVDMGTVIKKLDVQISDQSGNVMFSDKINNLQVVDLNLSYPAGIYFLIVKSGNKRAVIKVVKI